jgi:hypothetical protein
LIISYVVDDTFNVRQLASLTANALPAVAAAMLEESDDMEVRFKDWVVIEGDLMHPGHIGYAFNIQQPTSFTLNALLVVAVAILEESEDMDLESEGWVGWSTAN